jgi:DNA helicase-2/ATP-dependent DNA helicase PcrA
VNYTASQAAAVACVDRNLQVIACAGSGKTEVISARIVEILKRQRGQGIGPANIVAFTFTDKAAAELKDRISRLVKAEFGPLPGLAEMYVGTIHGFCLELLQTGLYRFLKYGVLSDVQNRLLVARNSQKSGLGRVEVLSGPGRGQRLAKQDVKVFLQALNVIQEDKVDQARLPEGLKEAHGLYGQLLDRHAYLDFSGIMVEAVTALYADDEEATRLQEIIARRVKHVVVDEYQDVNPIQEELVKRLHALGATICVVGDDDQTIYQWRGSDIGNILEFSKRYPKVQSNTLAENFRSSEGIVETGRKIAEVNNPNRLPKKMLAAGHQTYERGDLLALTFTSPHDEARWIVKKILELRGFPFKDSPDSEPRGLSWSDFAVLTRANKSGESIADALRAAGVPYIASGLAGLFDTPEAIAAVSMFKFIDGSVEEAAVRADWHAAQLGLTDADLDRGLAVLLRARTWTPSERWSTYNIQRTFLDFLEAAAIREERVPPTSTGAPRGEIVFYNLGKFSQVISDFEQIYFQSEPQEKYRIFSLWLEHEAPGYYEEGGEAKGFAQPDAVLISTIHQAKGMEWPVVFIPAFQKNRFPSTTGSRGRTKWHILPREAVPNAARYDTSEADERRLFYVAVTRSKKYLFCTYAPTPGNQLFQKPSPFFREFTGNPLVLTREASGVRRTKIGPRARRESPNVVLSFSELKYFFECPYQFKLRFLYGFNPPIYEGLGYGKSLHDALAEIHKRALDGDIVTEDRIEPLVDKHLHTPFAYPALRTQLRQAAIESAQRYLREHGAELRQTLHSEKQVEIQLEGGVTVNGRIDLIRRLDTDEVSIVDFKSSERAQSEDVSSAQLHTYALGYQQLTGSNADILEILTLDSGATSIREVVDARLLSETEAQIQRAGDAVRENRLLRLESWCGTCAKCDLAGVCRPRTT